MHTTLEYLNILSKYRSEKRQQCDYSRDFNTPLSAMGRSSGQKIKKTLELNYTSDEIDLADIIYSIHTNSSIIHILLKSTQYILQDRSNNKPPLSKFKVIELILNNFSDLSGIKLVINKRKAENL